MKNIIPLLLVLFLVLGSCRIKEPCELNNLGDICITNNTAESLQVFINEEKIMEIAPNGKSCVTRSVGIYSLKCFAGTEEWIISDVDVIRCEIRNLRVPEDAWAN